MFIFTVFVFLYFPVQDQDDTTCVSDNLALEFWAELSLLLNKHTFLTRSSFSFISSCILCLSLTFKKAHAESESEK